MTETDNTTRKQEILHQRALALAREPDAPTSPADAFLVIEFILAHEKYAIEVGHIREVQPLKDLTPLPCTPPFLLGIINVRGQILAVIDMKNFFDLPETDLTDRNRVIIVYAGEMEVGILADEILGVRSVRRHDVQPSLPTLTGIRADYLKGVTSERLVLLDIPAMLFDTKILVDEEVD